MSKSYDFPPRRPGRPSLAPTALVQPVEEKPAPVAIDPYSMGLRDAADYIGLHYMTVFAEVKSGALPTKKYGTKHLVRRADLEAWFDALPDGVTGEQRKAS